MFASHREEFKRAMGRDPTDQQLYMMHQQGLGFYTNNKMTNIQGNKYPGMHGPQTHESFEEGWGRELDRRKASFGAERPVPDAARNPSSARRDGEQQSGFEPTFPHNRFTTTANMNPELLARLQAMYDASPDSAKGKSFLESGYRPATRAESEALGMDPRTSQESVWDRHVRNAKGRSEMDEDFNSPSVAAHPGHSRHQGGNAADIIDPSGWYHQHAKEYGLHFPVRGDYPHAQMDPGFKGQNFYTPQADQSSNNKPEEAVRGPNGEMIVFGGLRGQLDRESAARIAAAKGLTPRYFDYRDTEAALKHAKGLDRPYESMGFSAGVGSQDRFAGEARKRGIQMPRSATSVGQYAPEGGKTQLPSNSGVPTENYLDPSGKDYEGRFRRKTIWRAGTCRPAMIPAPCLVQLMLSRQKLRRRRKRQCLTRPRILLRQNKRIPRVQRKTKRKQRKIIRRETQVVKRPK
jgi:hypothetical protein